MTGDRWVGVALLAFTPCLLIWVWLLSKWPDIATPLMIVGAACVASMVVGIMLLTGGPS